MVQANNKREGLFPLIGQGFSNVFKNPRVIVAMLIFSILCLVLLIVGMLVVFKILGISLASLSSMSQATSEAAGTQLISNIQAALQTPGTIAFLAVMFILFILVFLIIMSYFYAGVIGMMNEFLDNGKKTGLSEMNKYGFRFLGRFILYYILLFLALIVLNIILSLPLLAMTQGSTLYTVVSIIIMIITILCYLFFVLSEYAMILDNCSVWKGIKKSFSIVGKNYLLTLLLFVIFLAIIWGAMYVPVVGFFLAFVIIMPAMMIALLLLAKKRK